MSLRFHFWSNVLKSKEYKIQSCFSPIWQTMPHGCGLVSKHVFLIGAPLVWIALPSGGRLGIRRLSSWWVERPSCHGPVLPGCLRRLGYASTVLRMKHTQLCKTAYQSMWGTSWLWTDRQTDGQADGLYWAAWYTHTAVSAKCSPLKKSIWMKSSSRDYISICYN